MSTSCPPSDTLDRLLTGELSGPAAQELRRHVDDCGQCQAALGRLAEAGAVPGRRLANVSELPTALGPPRGSPDLTLRGGPARPAPPFLGPPQRAGDLASLGPYRIEAELGRGGMGVVYRAQDDGLQRTVAVKVLLPELAADLSARARFIREAQAAGRIRHDHVVAVYAVGQPPDSLPYLVMEYLAGPTLAGLLHHQGPLPPRRAATLLAEAADGVAAAHAVGLIHRDIKPGNILLDPATGRAKISDFGLVRLTEAPGNLTQKGDLAGTPQYMSPEQASDQDLDFRSDIYSLGVTLYEALTGSPPFRGTLTMVLYQVAHDEPTPPRRLNDAVPRDLETICMKCLEKQPHRRYPSASALADDLRRFLDHQPVHARPTPAHERLAKWVRRRPAAAALVAVSVLATAALLGLALWSNVQLRRSAERAEARSRLARRAADDMYTQVAEKWLAHEPQMGTLEREFLLKALALYEEVAADDPTEPAMRRQQALAHFRVGQISRTLGQRDRAEQAYRQALTLQEALSAEFPGDPDYVQDTATTYNWLGELLRAGGRRLEEAEAAYREALRRQQQLVADYPRWPAYRKDLARSYCNLGLVQKETGRAKAAEEDYGRAIAELSRLHKEAPGEPDYRHELARAYLNRGAARSSQSDADEAIRLLQGLARQFPSRPGYRYELAIARTNRANVLLGDRTRHKDGEAELSQARDLFARLAADFPERLRYHYELANCLNSLAAHCAGAPERYAEAEGIWLKALDVLTDLVKRPGDVADYLCGLGRVYGNLGWLDVERGRLESACRRLEEGQRHVRAARKLNPENPDYLDAMRNLCQTLAEARVRSGEHAGASAAARGLLEASRASGHEDYFLAACFAARCAGAAQADARISPAKRGDVEKGYAGQALAWLREAARRGWRDTKAAKKDARLQALRDHPDFTRLMEELDRQSASQRR